MMEQIWQVVKLCPFIVLFISYFVLKKLKIKQTYVVGISADLTTLLLFISIPTVVQLTWGFSVYIIVVISAIVCALIFTVVDWRTKKEIEIGKLFKKVWRVYFVFYASVYIIVGIGAIVQHFVL